MQACLCRLMSMRRTVPDLEETILLYMDTMVELDRWILCLAQDDSMLGSNDQDSDDVESMNVSLIICQTYQQNMLLLYVISLD